MKHLIIGTILLSIVATACTEIPEHERKQRDKARAHKMDKKNEPRFNVKCYHQGEELFNSDVYYVTSYEGSIKWNTTYHEYRSSSYYSISTADCLVTLL